MSSDEKKMAGGVEKKVRPKIGSTSNFPFFLLPSPNTGYLNNNFAYQQGLKEHSLKYFVILIFPYIKIASHNLPLDKLMVLCY